MQCSGLQVFAFLLLLGGTVLIAISICTDSWFKTTPLEVESRVISGQLDEVERGLWRECRRDHIRLGGLAAQDGVSIRNEDCGNRYEELRKEVISQRQGEGHPAKYTKVQVWEIAVLGLMCGSALLGILSLLFSPCCCNRCGCCLASFVFFAASLCASAVCTYAYYAWTSKGDHWLADHIEHKKQFGWSFWCAVAGGACQFFSGVMFAVSRCRQHSYSHTV